MPDVHVRGSPVSSRVAEQINQSAPAAFLGKSITDMLSLVLCGRPQVECVVATSLGTIPQPGSCSEQSIAEDYDVKLPVVAQRGTVCKRRTPVRHVTEEVIRLISPNLLHLLLGRERVALCRLVGPIRSIPARGLQVVSCCSVTFVCVITRLRLRDSVCKHEGGNGTV
jgi:hypothetical protein